MDRKPIFGPKFYTVESLYNKTLTTLTPLATLLEKIKPQLFFFLLVPFKSNKDKDRKTLLHSLIFPNVFCTKKNQVIDGFVQNINDITGLIRGITTRYQSTNKDVLAT